LFCGGEPTMITKTRAVKLRDAIARRTGEGRDELGVAMLSAILFMIIVAGLATIMVSVVLGQVAPSYIAQKGTQTVYAAQAGLQAALGQLRSASQIVTGKQIGNVKTLPCTVTGSLNPGSTDGLSYSVKISYFPTDPTGQSDSWLTAHQFACKDTVGNSDSGVTVPAPTTQPLKYALMVSQGIGGAIPGTSDTTDGNRSIAAVYTFEVSNTNIVGGRIYDYNNNNSYCMSAVPTVAGGTTTKTGGLIQFLPASKCVAGPTTDPLQLWIYGQDYEIKLAASTVAGYTGGALCITGPANSTDPTNKNQSAILRPCVASPSLTRWNQQWNWVGSNTWQGMNSAISATSTWYLATGKASGTALLPTDYVQVSTSPVGGFSPSTSVGAGAASKITNEIVNYKEFGRCTDVTDETITDSFMISYPCKQDPSGGKDPIKWNQLWYYTEPTAPKAGAPVPAAVAGEEIYVYDSTGKLNCLTRPSPAISGSYVTFKACTSSDTKTFLTTDPNQSWTRNYDTGDYPTSYLFTDPKGLLCLSVASDAAHLYKGWSEIVVASCDGTDAQKWNAPPSTTKSFVGGYKEIAG
jgi:hypothetical protein